MEIVKFIFIVTGVFVWLLIIFVFITALIKTIKSQIQMKRDKKEASDQLEVHLKAKCFCADCIHFSSGTCYYKIIPPNVNPNEWFCRYAILRE